MLSFLWMSDEHVEPGGATRRRQPAERWRVHFQGNETFWRTSSA